MSAYSAFAPFYDKLQRNVPYGDMAALFDKFINKYGDENEVVVDLACGTGSLCEKMAELGYDVIGVDLSEQMLSAAVEKAYDKGLEISYLRQNMTQLDLYGAADAVICVLDSLNHLENKQELERTIERVSMFTCDGGLFIFDVNTRYKHREILADNCFCFETDEVFCVWQNFLCEDDCVNIRLDFFQKQQDGGYKRYSEDFREIVFEESFLEKTLEENYFEVVARFDDFSENPPCEQSQRILYVCKRLKR